MPSREELRELIIQHGGIYKQYMDGKMSVTHIIASSLPPSKRVEFKRYKVLKPSWITDSIAEGKTLPWYSYRTIDDVPSQRLLNFGAKQSEEVLLKRPTEATDSYKQEMIRMMDSRDRLDQVLLDRNNAAQNVESVEGDKNIVEEEHPVNKFVPQTAEEHNASLLANNRIRRSTAVDPDFIQSYFGSSRLHHLSSWKAGLKAQMQQFLASGMSNPQVTRKPGGRRYIMHADFDCFFAAVAARERPDLADKPICVGHGGQNGGEIASCNYKAREFGVRNGTWMKTARESCPDLICLGYDFPAYEVASKEFYDVLLNIGADVVQPVSVDEALLDVTSKCQNELEESTLDVLAKTIRNELKNRTQLDVSVGSGVNILLAKVALRKAKPAGQIQIRPGEELQLLSDLNVRDLPGIGYRTAQKLQDDLKVENVSDLRKYSQRQLQQQMGPKTGTKLYEYARGVDNDEVGNLSERKSVSVEVNWGIRFSTQAQVDDFLINLAKELTNRLNEVGMGGHHMVLKVMKRAASVGLDAPKFLGHGECDLFNKSVMFGVPTTSSDIIGKETINAMKSLKIMPGDLRGIGLQMTKLEKAPKNSDKVQPKLLFPKDTNDSIEIQPRAVIEDEFTESNVPEDPDVLSKNATAFPEESGILKTKERSIPEIVADKHSSSDIQINTSQLEVPSQIDPDVFAQLPDSLKSKIEKHVVRKRNAEDSYALPSRSQIDSEVYEAMPEDIKQEYNNTYLTRSRAKAAMQNAQRTPQKKVKFIGDTLTQAGYVHKSPSTTPTKGRQNHRLDYMFSPSSKFDKDVLAELPESIRKELIAQAREEYLDAQEKAAENKLLRHYVPVPPAVLHVPTRPSMPTFQKRSSIADIRALITTWVKEYSDEGPHNEDVNAFCTYLTKVVHIERNITKAKSILQWLLLQCEERSALTSNGLAPEWDQALTKLNSNVQDACEARNMGSVKWSL